MDDMREPSWGPIDVVMLFVMWSAMMAAMICDN
jgi:hypothetical protein